MFEAKRVTLTGVRTLYIHNLQHSYRNPLQWPLSACFEKHFVASLKHSMHQRNQLTLLQHRLAARDLNQPRSWAEVLNFVEDLLGSHFLAAVKTVFGVAPRAAQIATGQAHEYARHASVCRFPLQRLVNLSDLHLSVPDHGATGVLAHPRPKRR